VRQAMRGVAVVAEAAMSTEACVVVKEELFVVYLKSCFFVFFFFVDTI
jgi:hypothetical protein